MITSMFDPTTFDPETWPSDVISPPVDAIKRAYIEDRIDDSELDDYLEWSMSTPDPPAGLRFVEDDEFELQTRNLPTVARDTLESMDGIWIDEEYVEWVVHGQSHHSRRPMYYIYGPVGRLDDILELSTYLDE